RDITLKYFGVVADELRYLRGLAGATQGAGRETK
ncbi:hypothetical protein LCGC14_1766110, partial [marine sediment metagenome]